MNAGWATAVSVVAGSGLLGAVAAWLRANAAHQRLNAQQPIGQDLSQLGIIYLTQLIKDGRLVAAPPPGQTGSM